MKLHHFKLSVWLASVYFAWSVLVYFGSLMSNSHEWWPMFLYPLIWPLSAIHEWLSVLIVSWSFPDFRAAPAWVFTVNDYVAGGFYIVIGTVWIFLLPTLLGALGKGAFGVLAGKNS